MYVARERLGVVAERGVEGPPSLAVEVISPSTRQRDRNEKLQLYARHGVPCVWVIDPDARSVEAYVLRSGAYVLQTQAVGHESLRAEPIPDLAISIATLWT